MKSDEVGRAEKKRENDERMIWIYMPLSSK